jgi:hypothetical protein
MSEEAELIAKAIESLRADSNWFKDYLFPIVGSFLSAILGAFVAYFTLQFQEKNKAEKEKLQVCNDWTLSVEGLFQSLIALKGNYYENITGDPFQRALHVRSIIGENSQITRNVSELSFLVPTKDGVISNYNLILKIWDKRDSIERPLREKLITAFGDKAYADIEHQQILDTLSERDLVNLIDLTEKAIHLTDDIILELNDFLCNFPNVAKSLIKIKKVKKYGRLITFDNSENNFLQTLMKKCPELECKTLVNLYGKPESVIQKLYDNGY